MTVRDRIVACVLGGGVLFGLIAWKGLSPWAALAIALLAVIVAAAVYRTEPPATPWEHEERIESEPAHRS